MEAITKNNSPKYDWGPKRNENCYGMYAHLNSFESKNDIRLNEIRASSITGYVNENFQCDNIPMTSAVSEEKF